MSYGIVTKNAQGSQLSAFTEVSLRFLHRIRIEASTSGSIQLNVPVEKVWHVFHPDTLVNAVNPVFTLSPTGLLSWAPFPDYQEFHKGGYLLVLAQS